MHLAGAGYAVDAALLRAGAERVRHACERSLIPYALLTAGPADDPGWLEAAGEAVERALLSRDQFAR